MKKASLILCGALVFGAILTGCGASQKTNLVNTPANNPLINAKDAQQKDGTNNAQTPQSKNNGITIQAQSPKEIKMDAILRKNLNIFFSNFAEAEVKPFEKDKISNDDLILFAIHHIAANDDDLVERPNRGSDGRLNAKYVEWAVNKYFGKKVTHKTQFIINLTDPSENKDYYCTYKDGYYTIPYIPVQIDPIAFPRGEAGTGFSQITKLIDNSNSFYTAYVNVYTMNDYTYISEEDRYNATPHEWEKKYGKDSVPSFIGKMKATIKKDTDERYILIDYLKDE